MPSILSAVFVACCSGRHSLRARDDWVQNQPLLLPCCLQLKYFERRGHDGRSFYLTSTPVKQWRNISSRHKNNLFTWRKLVLPRVDTIFNKRIETLLSLTWQASSPWGRLDSRIRDCLGHYVTAAYFGNPQVLPLFLAVLRKLPHYCPKGSKVALTENGVRFNRVMLPTSKQRSHKTVS